MEKYKNTIGGLLVACATVLLMGTIAIAINVNNTITDLHSLLYYVEEANNRPIDTSVIEVDWGIGYEGEQVRMVCGWMYADGIVEDQLGHLWEYDAEMSQDDFFLLWINDNATPNDITDDTLMQLWREA